MSYETCNALWPSPPCPTDWHGQHLGDAVGWTAAQPYPATCTYTTRETVSVIMGMLSIMSWMLVSAPQLYINYKLKKAESLSFFFLLQWFSGDTTNLIGCYLTNQNIGQKFLAMYYVLQDVALFSQYLYYMHVNRTRTGVDYQGELGDEDYDDNRGDSPEDARNKRNSVCRPVADVLSSAGNNARGSDVSSCDDEYQSMKTREGMSFKSTSGVGAAYSSRRASGNLPSLGDMRRGAGSRQGSVDSSGEAPVEDYDFDNAYGSGGYMRGATYSIVSKKRSGEAMPQGSLRSDTPGGDSRTPPAKNRGSVNAAPVVIKGVALLLGVSLLGFSAMPASASVSFDAAPAAAGAASRRLLGAVGEVITQTLVPETDAPQSSGSDSGSKEEVYFIGIAIGWISAALYLGSRIPQLVKNCRRGTTDGLSPIMFTMAVIANTTYSLGIILLNPTVNGVLCHLPWIVGSVGTIQFDVMALFQFLYYRKSSNERLPLDEKSSLLRGPSALSATKRTEGRQTGDEAGGAFLEDAESEVHSVPYVLPASVYAGAIRKGYYGRIGIWYNE